MLPKVQNISALELCDASTLGSIPRVESLLASGVDPNARFDDLPSAFSCVAEDWASSAKSARPAVIFYDPNQAPALRRAAQDDNGLDGSDKVRMTRIMTTLLQHGADPYGLFRQPIHIYQDRPLFPEETRDVEFRYEETDLELATRSHREVLRKELEFEDFRRKAKPVPRMDDSDYESDCEYDMALAYQPQYPRRYGVCSVIHSLLEQGMFVRPVLEFLGDNLDTEQRDPQGRTLFLAACRSALGLDASIDGNMNALSWDSFCHCIRENPYPQPDNPWKQSESQTGHTKVCTGPTFLEYFVSHRADLFAVDNYGRNALHQLLICFHHEARTQPPIINASLNYLITNCPNLVNQPDHAEFRPLHLAIRRMGLYGVDNTFVPGAVYRLLHKAVDDLLAGGADPLARDGHGNTVLHYLAASRLGKDDRIGDEQRRLLRTFLDRGVDSRARNTAGLSALEIFFTRDTEPGSSDHDRYDAIDKEVIDLFEQAGYPLAETNPAGQTLLHIVAGQVSDRAYAWFQHLQAKGLDAAVKDKEGRTPMDIAAGNKILGRQINRNSPKLNTTRPQDAFHP